MGIESKDLGHQLKAYLEIPEIERLENAAMYLRDKLLIRLLFHLGCRVSAGD